MPKFKQCIALAILGGSAAWLQTGAAAERNDIPSCYTWAKMTQQRPAPSGRELTVIVDQTVGVPLPLQDKAWAHMMRYLRPGDAVRLYTFSAITVDQTGNQYLQLPFVAQLETPLEGKVRNSIGSKTLKQLDTCLKQQMEYFYKAFGEKFKSSFEPEGGAYKTEILSTLQKISTDIAARPATDRVVLLISDMLENSSTTSFYDKGGLRDLDLKQEMKKARLFITNFDGARFYVHAAGFIPSAQIDSGKYLYYSGEKLLRLERFWREYLKQSNASLQGFGAPELTTDLR